MTVSPGYRLPWKGRCRPDADIRLVNLTPFRETGEDWLAHRLSCSQCAHTDRAGEHPGHAVELTMLKLWRYWKPWPSAAQFGGIGPALLVALFFVPVCVLAARGWWLCRYRLWAWLLTLGPIVYFAAIHAVFVGSLRYRLPTEYPLCVLAAAGLNDVLLRWRGRRNDEIPNDEIPNDEIPNDEIPNDEGSSND